MKIPSEAKPDFKGIIYSVYQWDQERYDGSHTTYEMIARPHSSMVIPINGEKIFISRQEQPGTGIHYALFGGQIEEHEEPEKAAKREQSEEAGLESDSWELYKTYEPMKKFDWNMYLFIARNARKMSEQHVDPGEKIEILQVNFEEFIKIVQSDEFWGRELTLDLFRIEKAGKLEEFKNRLFTLHS